MPWDIQKNNDPSNCNRSHFIYFFQLDFGCTTYVQKSKFWSSNSKKMWKICNCFKLPYFGLITCWKVISFSIRFRTSRLSLRILILIQAFPSHYIRFFKYLHRKKIYLFFSFPKNRLLTWISRVEQRPGKGSECGALSWSTRWPRTRRRTSGAAPWLTSLSSPCPPAFSTTRTRTFSRQSRHSNPLKGCPRQHLGTIIFCL